MYKLIYRFIFVFLVIAIQVATAQHFEWASSGSNILTGYSKSCVTSDGRLIAAGQYQTPSYRIADGDPVIFSGSGDEFKMDYYKDQFFVTCYNAQGGIDWMIKGSEISNSGRINGVTSLADGTVVIAFKGSPANQHATRMNKDGSSESIYFDGYGRSKLSPDVPIDFFAEIDERGRVKRVYIVENLIEEEWLSFAATPEGDFIVAQAYKEKVKDKTGKLKDIGHNYVQKVAKNYILDWTYKFQYMDESCCSYFEKSSLAAVGNDGDIYVSGSAFYGIKPQDRPVKMAPVLDVVSQYNEPYESYVARISATGKLKWIKYSDGKSLISDISVENNQLVIGGKIMLQKKLFGMKIDTTEKKKAFISAFDLDGNPKWTKTFNALDINAVSQDFDGNIFASFKNDRSRGIPPLKIGTDTVSDAFHRVIVASFDANGNYRWYKMSRAMMSNEPTTSLHNDQCGNLYFVGEMWYSLKVNMSLFDGAIVKGTGYGGAPIAARIRTTIPDELLTLNITLSQSIPVKFKEKPEKEKPEKVISKPEKTITIPPVRTPTNQQNLHPDSIKSGRCVQIPFPWKLELFPNPTDGIFTARASISYSDNKVSLELWDMKGNFVETLSAPQLREVGTFDISCDVSSRAAGVYIIMLKGTGSAITERLIKK